MTINELIKEQPEASQELFNKAFEDGRAFEREQWQARVVSEERTGEILDEILIEALTTP